MSCRLQLLVLGRKNKCSMECPKGIISCNLKERTNLRGFKEQLVRFLLFHSTVKHLQEADSVLKCVGAETFL